MRPPCCAHAALRGQESMIKTTMINDQMDVFARTVNWHEIPCPMASSGSKPGPHVGVAILAAGSCACRVSNLGVDMPTPGWKPTPP